MNDQYWEVGGSIGMPAVMQIMCGKWFNFFGVRLTGMHFIDKFGIQADFNFKFMDTYDLNQGFGIGLGYFDFSSPSKIVQFEINGQGGQGIYCDIHYFINADLFYFQFGISYGKFNISNIPILPFVMIGINYRFLPGVEKRNIKAEK